MKVSPEELKAAMDSLTTDTLSAYQVRRTTSLNGCSAMHDYEIQTEVFSKLQEKEKALINRLSKLEKSLT